MFSSVISSASTYFYLPIEEEDQIAPCSAAKKVPWKDRIASSEQCPTSASTTRTSSTSTCDSLPSTRSRRQAAITEILSSDDLYKVLGIPRSKSVDKLALRRAYLSRSKACHPDKFPHNPEATRAFQKVCVAYDVLSQPASKRLYDSSPTTQDYFSARPPGHADHTFRGVVLGVFNDFLDGDLEMVRTLLRAINDINPSLKLGEDGINSVMGTLQSLRDRALTCRTCVLALHTELTRLLEVQQAFRQLSYFDIIGRSRLTVQLARITLNMPIAIERAIKEQDQKLYGHDPDGDQAVLLPRRMTTLIRGIVVVLERMERFMK